jgi:hypothetical protein
MSTGLECELEECEESITELLKELTRKESEAEILRLQIDRCN